MQITNKININLKKTFWVQYLIISIGYFLFQQHDIVTALGKGLFINILLFVLYGLLFFVVINLYWFIKAIVEIVTSLFDIFLFIITFGNSNPLKYSWRYTRDISFLKDEYYNNRRVNFTTGEYQFFFQGINQINPRELYWDDNIYWINDIKKNNKRLKYFRNLAKDIENGRAYKSFFN